MLGWSPESLPERQRRFRRSSLPELHVVRDRLLPPSFRTAAPQCALDEPRSVETRSSAGSWVGVFGNGALRARIVVSASSILNRHVQLLRSLRRRAASACGEFIAIEPRLLPEPKR